MSELLPLQLVASWRAVAQELSLLERMLVSAMVPRAPLQGHSQPAQAALQPAQPL